MERRQGGKGEMKGRKREREKSYAHTTLLGDTYKKLLSKIPQPKQHIQGLSTLIKLALGTEVPAWKSVNYVGSPGHKEHEERATRLWKHPGS